VSQYEAKFEEYLNQEDERSFHQFLLAQKFKLDCPS
jgi:hypothetical protein